MANTGGGTLSYSASDNAPWLSLSPASGTAPQDITATVKIAGLAPGDHTATITVTATSARIAKDLPVTLTIAPAQPPGCRHPSASLSRDRGHRQPGANRP